MRRPQPITILALALIAAGMIGCGGTPGSSQARDAEKALAGAPQEWGAFTQWVEKQLRQTPPAVPLPDNPKLASPRYPMDRLIAAFPQAKVQSTWQPPESTNKPLQVLGPFRSDRPTASFRATRSFDRRSGAALDMRVRGITPRCEEIGRIAIELQAPWGAFIDLIWGTAGQVRVPIPDNQDVWTLDVNTDGLTEWLGSLGELTIRADGFQDGVFDIRSIKFFGHDNLFPKAVDVCRVTIDRVRVDAIYAHSPARITFENVRLGPNTRFQAAVASVDPTRRPDAGAPTATSHEVEFELIVNSGQEQSVLKLRPPSPDRWFDAGVSLAPWAGQTVSLTLASSGGAEGRVALWSNPALYEPVDKPPIVVVYLIDTLTARRSSLYGYARPTMPRIANLAQRGVWFAQMRANSPVTVASVPHLMLSMPTERHGVFNTSVAAPLELVTISDALRALGFSTSSYITNPFAGPRQNMDQGFDHFVDRVSLFWHDPAGDRTVPIEEILDWLQTHADRPAFVYVHTAEPHAPYLPPEGFRGRFDPDYTGNIDGSMDPQKGFAACRSTRDVEHVRALYDEEVLYADHRFGLFEDALKERGFFDRTTFFVVSDHGEELLEHGNWGHGPTLYEELLRVPLVAAGPLVTARGRIDQMVCMYDIMPTLLDLLGAPQPYELAGESLAGFLRAEGGHTPPADRVHIVAHFRHRGYGLCDYAITESLRWKLITRTIPAGDRETARVSYELYDLAADPYETKNVLDQNQDVARRLLGTLLAYHVKQHPYQTSGSATLKFDAKQLRDLRGLGYIGGDH